jgi:hypothetical protein
MKRRRFSATSSSEIGAWAGRLQPAWRIDNGDGIDRAYPNTFKVSMSFVNYFISPAPANRHR